MFTAPPPVILVSMLGSVAAGSALAAGTTLQKLWLSSARFAGVAAIICCNSATLTLSAFRVNCTWGAAKFLSVSAPVALVCPTEAARFSRIVFFFQAEDGIRDYKVTGVQTCALPIFLGLTFTLKLLERHEGKLHERYKKLAEYIPQSDMAHFQAMMESEESQEDLLIGDRKSVV